MRTKESSSIKIFVGFIACVFLITNTWVLWKFLRWINDFEHACRTQFDFSNYLAVQAQQNSLLQTYIVVFTLGVTFLAIWGYSTIKHGAEKIAEYTANEVLKKYIEHLNESKGELEKIRAGFGHVPIPDRDVVKEIKD